MYVSQGAFGNTHNAMELHGIMGVGIVIVSEGHYQACSIVVARLPLFGSTLTSWCYSYKWNIYLVGVINMKIMMENLLYLLTLKINKEWKNMDEPRLILPYFFSILWRGLNALMVVVGCSTNGAVYTFRRGIYIIVVESWSLNTQMYGCYGGSVPYKLHDKV